MPNFNPKEIQHLFATLEYPYQIRADAITAVGAPSSIGFLMRAIYWLYLVTRTYYRQALPGAIAELISEEEDAASHKSHSRTETEKSIFATQDEVQTILQHLLKVVEESQHSFSKPPQLLRLDLPNEVGFPSEDRLLQLLLFEYQEFLH